MPDLHFRARSVIILNGLFDFSTMDTSLEQFDRFFAAISYGVVFCGFLSLFSTGDLGILVSGVFLLTFVIAWFLEGSRWQISERVGTVSLFIVVPLFYLGWKFQIIGSGASNSQIAGLLARVILVLAVIKLFQRKTDRDWLFLYLMAFFEVLLAAGMSISPLYLGTIVIYLLVTICAIISFEIRRTSNSVSLLSKTSGLADNQKSERIHSSFKNRLPLTAVALLVLIIIVGTPLFFAFPRTGGAGFGNNSKGMSGFTGFSDTVELGAIGKLKQNDEIVMRVVVDEARTNDKQSLRWRGVALDRFDNKVWRKSNDIIQPFARLSGDLLRFDQQATSGDNITTQTIYLEPIDSSVLFSLSRPFAIRQSQFQNIYRDSNSNITFQRTEFQRIAYTIYSDVSIPHVTELVSDNLDYPSEIQAKYLQLPETFDARIAQLAFQVSENSQNRYDKAKDIEAYLQTQFGYTLEMKATGDEPLADFLFNVREGHCEYFATAMTVMLRTQGIAARVVNGFQQGEYNETAGAYIVKQKDAHSWVEVYFPESESWVAFDPTPFAGQSNEYASAGIFGSFSKYLEALETLWVQYFVAFDNQDQRSLFRSVKSGFVDFQEETSSWLKIAETQIAEWWKEVRGDKGLQTSALAIAYGVAYLFGTLLGIFLIVWLIRKIRDFAFWQKFRDWLKQKNDATIIEFYERMQKVLASKGFTREPHQTPLEFAFALEMPEAVKITEKYNSVRFGEKYLSKSEAHEIEDWLSKLSNIDRDE